MGVEILAFVNQVGEIKACVDIEKVTLSQIESNIVRCPDEKKAQQMIELIEKIRNDGDSIGGVIIGVVKNPPLGLGEPVFDKLSADLAKAMFSIPAVKGFEIGSGFSSVLMRGSTHNDQFFVDKNGKIRTKTNFSGGIQGGISNGETIYFKVAFKPVSTIKKRQKTVNRQKQEVILEAAGRHDPCVLPRAVPIVEAMTALVLLDHYLRHKAQNLWNF